jgi:hypothetical protein
VLSEWWMKGIICPRWTHLPMFILSSPFEVHLWSSISLIPFEYARSLFSGRAIVICLKFNNQLRMTFVSVSAVSALSFAQASLSSQGSGSSGDTLQETAVSPRSGAHLSWVLLSKFSVSTVMPMKLLMYMLTIPLVSTGILMIGLCQSQSGCCRTEFLWMACVLGLCTQRGLWGPNCC